MHGDAKTGEQIWRVFTVPGDPSLPFEQPELEMAAKTWKGGNWWEIGGGGTVWNSIVYDPDFNVVYLGVGNGSPWTRAIRSPGGGDNLFLSSIVAVDADMVVAGMLIKCEQCLDVSKSTQKNSCPKGYLEVCVCVHPPAI